MNGDQGVGMMKVDCPLCGENLGYQQDNVPIDWKMWPHNRCKVRIRDMWHLTGDDIDDLTKIVEARIAACYPDFPEGHYGDPEKDEFRAFRGRLAAGHLFDALLARGWQITRMTRAGDDWPS